MTAPDVEALVFDVFGTVVDWRSGVIRDGEQFSADREIDIDWAAFADASGEARFRGGTSIRFTGSRSRSCSIASASKD